MALTGLTELQFTNLNVTGVATFAQSVGIAGTLSYEDVTNIDSVGVVTARVGVITARSGVKVNSGQVSVGAGTSLHSTCLDLGTGNITGNNLKSSGIITATKFVGDGSSLSGLASREFYGFVGVGSHLQLVYTNNGADNISSTSYASLEENFFGPSGITFEINTDGRLIATV